jgi:uncharacterized protein YjiS (DUF1127 family)
LPIEADTCGADAGLERARAKPPDLLAYASVQQRARTRSVLGTMSREALDFSQ